MTEDSTRASGAGFLLEKNLRGAKDNRPLFLKQYAIVPIVASIVVLKILGNKRLLGGGQKSFWGAPTLPPCSRKPVEDN